MQAESRYNKKLKMLQPKKVKGGVGEKKKSIFHTPIRLSTVSRNVDADYTGQSIGDNDSYSNYIQSKSIYKNSENKKLTKPDWDVITRDDLITPVHRTKQSKNKMINSQSSISSKWGNTVLNLINNHQKSKIKVFSMHKNQTNQVYYEMNSTSELTMDALK
jgi:hypothetical protein